VALFVPRSGKTKGHVSDLTFPRHPAARHRDNAIKKTQLMKISRNQINVNIHVRE
jgi:hypothetical protein